MNQELKKIYDEEAIKIVNYTIKKKYKYLKYFESYEDMKQTLLLKLWQALPRFDISKSKFITFGIFVCQTEIKNQIRKSCTQKRNGTNVSIEEEIAEGLTIGDTLSDNSDLWEDTYNKEILDKIVKNLNKETYLYIVEGKKKTEIASMFNLSKQCVSVKIKNNLKRIKLILNNDLQPKRKDKDIVEKLGISLRTYYRKKSFLKMC